MSLAHGLLHITLWPRLHCCCSQLCNRQHSISPTLRGLLHVLMRSPSPQLVDSSIPYTQQASCDCSKLRSHAHRCLALLPMLLLLLLLLC
jgi:hypothetical protein